MRSFHKGIEQSNSFLKAEKKRKVSPENANEDIIGTEAANCGNNQMDWCTINEGGGQDDIQVSFPDTQFPFIPNVPTAAKAPHGGGIKIIASRSRKQPEEVVAIDEHGPAKRTHSKTSATKSSSGSLSIGTISQKGKVSTGTNILTSNVAVVISEPPEHEALDKYNDRVNYEDSRCLDLSSHDDANPDSVGSQGEQIGSSLLSKNKRRTLVQLYLYHKLLLMISLASLDLGVTFAAMAKEGRPSQSSAILHCQHVKGGVVTSLNEVVLIRLLAIEKDRKVEILSSPAWL
ncbi:hypothetical protein MRB53_016519 [Persea americana]|uniref:Uncharacterized protein n=1 Tax=Persea americana TaxID=3435 RepID=A0ACC2M2K0_PERAE|nr:hypothetical protein MRB53_016519 [Persea americana]